MAKKASKSDKSNGHAVNGHIEVIGARVHNLKEIDVSIPRNQFVVITGISGSGKSSLAFDTIYAEGQRRYMETFTAYARQFIGEMERPDVEKITGLRALSYKVATVLKKNLVIRKSEAEIKVGDLTLYRNEHAVMLKGKRVELSQHEFELLYFLAQNPKKSISTDNLLHNIWGSEVYLFAKSVDTYVQNIKQKLGMGLISKVKEDQYRLMAS